MAFRLISCQPICKLTPGIYSINIWSLPSLLSVPKYITIRSCRKFFKSCSSVSNDLTSYSHCSHLACMSTSNACTYTLHVQWVCWRSCMINVVNIHHLHSKFPASVIIMAQINLQDIYIQSSINKTRSYGRACYAFYLQLDYCLSTIRVCTYRNFYGHTLISIEKSNILVFQKS